jgi:hydroxymethylbilane synthase
MILRIGVRGSKLALAYAERVCNELSCDTEIVIIKTAGDLHPDTPIHEIGGKGVFCNAIEQELLNGTIDVAVHSLKDMPGDVEHPNLEVCGVLERNTPHDVLIGKVFDGSRIGTSSPRRQAQVKQLFPNCEILPIRGNIDSRLKKLDNGEYDAIILAQAGLNELGIIR